ncbi:MAG: BMP family ABC transporter substrate-binding protein [Paracoccaceae bacterium]|jgi:basic membrane protein A|nr:BMP family ABC transporter substrate-binding protein [Paracoccaceae bacterium]|tara:strand:- start:59 stop:1069 length:1011 start_codon:yes stop_codon:yes gene_type:complete
MNFKKKISSLLLAGAVACATHANASDEFFVYVSPDPIGVNAFLEMGKIGIEAAAAKYNADVQTYESTSAVARRENVEAALNEGASLIVVLGFEFNDIISELAPTAPDVNFLIVDQCLSDLPANVHCAVFKEYEASYLTGVAAGMMTKSNKVGVVGALDIPFLHRYTDAYRDGAKAVNTNVDVEIRWVGGDNPFGDPVRAKEQALAMHAAGADIIFTATAGGDFGVFEAAKENNFSVFSVDVNRCLDAPGYVIDNTLKGVDAALLNSVDAIMSGAKSSVSAVGLKEGGMSVIALDADRLVDSKCLIADHPDVVSKVREVAAAIINGSLTLSDPMFAQ